MEIIGFSEVQETNLAVISGMGDSNPMGDFKIVMGSVDALNTVYVNVNATRAIFDKLVYSDKRETYLIEAVRNLLRKINVNDLQNELNSGEISDDEFDAILEREENKYVITLKDISKEDACIIYDLMTKVGNDVRDFTVDEVSELFSAKQDELISHLNF